MADDGFPRAESAEGVLTPPEKRAEMFSLWESRQKTWLKCLGDLAPEVEHQRQYFSRIARTREMYAEQAHSLKSVRRGRGSEGGSRSLSSSMRKSNVATMASFSRKSKKGSMALLAALEDGEAGALVAFQDVLRAFLIRSLGLECLLPSERSLFINMKLDNPHLWGPKANQVALIRLPRVHRQVRDAKKQSAEVPMVVEMANKMPSTANEHSLLNNPLLPPSQRPTFSRAASSGSVGTDPVVREALENEEKERRIFSQRLKEDDLLVEEYIETVIQAASSTPATVLTTAENKAGDASLKLGLHGENETIRKSDADLPLLGRSPRHEAAEGRLPSCDEERFHVGGSSVFLSSEEPRGVAPLDEQGEKSGDEPKNFPPSSRSDPIIVEAEELLLGSKDSLKSIDSPQKTTVVPAAASDPEPKETVCSPRSTAALDADLCDSVEVAETDDEQPDEVSIVLPDGSSLVLGLLPVEPKSSSLRLCSETESSCRLLDFSHLPRSIGNTQLSSLKGSLGRVTHLCLDECAAVTDDGVSSLLQHCSLLLTWSSAGLPLLSDRVVEAFLNTPSRAKLQMLNLRRCVNLGNDGVQKLVQGLPSLQTLYLGECHKVGDGWAVALSRGARSLGPNFTPYNLTALDLARDTKLSDALVEVLSGMFPQLRYLNISFCWRVSESAIRSLLEDTSITELVLEGCVKIVRRSRVELPRDFPHTNFVFETTAVTYPIGLVVDAGNSHVSSRSERVGRMRRDMSFAVGARPGVMSLSKPGQKATGVRDKVLSEQSVAPPLERHRSLQTIPLHRQLNRAQTLMDVRSPANVKGVLVAFSLDGRTLLAEREIVAALRSMTSVQQLLLARGVNVTDAVLALVRDRFLGATLRSLDLSWCSSLTKEGLLDFFSPHETMSVLGRSKDKQELRELSLESVNVVDEDVLRACSVELRVLTKLNIAACQGVNDEGLSAIADGMETLEEVNLSWCQRLTPQGIVQFLATRGKTLSTLSLYGCSSVNDDVLVAIASNCRSLRSLNIGWCHEVSGSGIEHVICEIGEGLELLNLYDTASGDNVLLRIGQTCSALRKLDLSRCNQITNSGLQSLLEGCKKLESVSVRGCEDITEAAIWALVTGLPKLKTLAIGDKALSLMSDSLRAQLSKASPLLKLK